MQDLIYASVTQLAAQIRDKQVSSEEVVRAYLDRIEAVNPTLNAVVLLTAESALAQARAADEALAKGESWGPLHGVPMTIKDSLDTAGVISTGGTLGRAQFVPEEDATVVARLKAAGAILMGKTNTPELTLNFETNNRVYGRTHNPYDLSRSPGGSSGGAVAIITSGGSPFDIGSDYGGSIRLPAHFCGVAGIKPTTGRVPRTGHIIPYAAGPSDSFQQIGPLARYVDDLHFLLSIIAGPDAKDPAIIPGPLPDPASVDLSSLRVVFHSDNGFVTPIPEIIQTVKAVAQALEGEVALVEEGCPDGLDITWDLWNKVANSDGRQSFHDVIARAGTTQISEEVSRVPGIKAGSGENVGRSLIELDQFRSRMLGFMADYDVMLCPVNANVAIKSGTLQEHIQGYSYTATHNLTGWPGAVVRAGTSDDGLPIGVQILARPYREEHALAVARFVEAQFGGWQAPPL